MTVWTVVAFVGGLVVLVGGADLLVRGAATLASRLGVSAVVVGLTVVAFGTSAPELVVSLDAAVSDQPGIALGNVVGSNTVNVLLILGVSAVISGLVVAQRLLRREIPIMVAVSVALVVMALDGRIGRVDGLLLVGAMVVYMVWLLRVARRERPDVLAEYDAEVEAVERPTARRPVWWLVGQIVVGLALLVVGGRLLVTAATDAATALGVSELVIGLTVVAVGTSLPELATSVLAAIRGERDIAVANVLGSNIFNLLFVLGVASVASGSIAVGDAARRVDIPVMIAAAIVLVPMCWSRFSVARWEGVALALFYVAYVAYLVLDAADHDGATLVGWGGVIAGGLVLLAATAAAVQTVRRSRHPGTPDTPDTPGTPDAAPAAPAPT
ncbi:MAG: calcium/sodium antiporter [Actinomycetota bacterium]